MKRLISILSMAMMLVCCVLAVPTAVSAVPATAPTFTDSSNLETLDSTKITNVYLNGLDSEISKNNGNLVITWDEGDIEKRQEVSSTASIYAGGKDSQVEPDDGEMFIGISAAVQNLYMGGPGMTETTQVEGKIYLNMDSDASISNLDVTKNGNTGGSHINLFGGNISNVVGAAGNDKITVFFNRAYYPSVQKLKEMGFGDSNLFKESFTVFLDAGEKGKFSDGTTITEMNGETGEVLIDPDNTKAQEILSEVTPTPVPGYKLEGWYLDQAFTRPFDLQRTVLKSEDLEGALISDGVAYITLYAKWVPVSHDTGESGTDGFLPVLLMMTGAAAGLAGGMRMMRKGASVK